MRRDVVASMRMSPKTATISHNSGGISDMDDIPEERQQEHAEHGSLPEWTVIEQCPLCGVPMPIHDGDPQDAVIPGKAPPPQTPQGFGATTLSRHHRELHFPHLIIYI